MLRLFLVLDPVVSFLAFRDHHRKDVSLKRKAKMVLGSVATVEICEERVRICQTKYCSRQVREVEVVAEGVLNFP
jgi:hypothetical protein